MAGSPFAIGGAGPGAGLGSQGAIQAQPRRPVPARRRRRQQPDLGAAARPRAACRTGRGARVVRRRASRSASRSIATVWSTSPTSATAAATTPASGSTPAALTPLPDSTFPVPEGSGVGDVLFNSTGDRLVGTRDNTSLIDSFAVAPDGVWRPRRLAVPGQGLGPIGAEFRPTNPSSCTSATRTTAPARHGVRVPRRPTGVLTSIGDSPVRRRPDRAVLGRDQPRRAVPVRDQHRLGATSRSYAINRDGSLMLLGTTAVHATAPARSTPDCRPDGRTLS